MYNNTTTYFADTSAPSEPHRIKHVIVLPDVRDLHDRDHGFGGTRRIHRVHRF